MQFEVTYTYGLNSTATGYTIIGVIRGIPGDVKHFEKPVKGQAMKRFYAASRGDMVYTRRIKVEWPQYTRIFPPQGWPCPRCGHDLGTNSRHCLVCWEDVHGRMED